MKMRGIAVFVIAMACSVAVLDAQEPVGSEAADGWCFRAQPAAECRGFLVTSAGPYAQMGALDVDRVRFVVDLGAMVNVSPVSALGGSLFIFGQSGDNVTAGPALRWRRWLSPTRSIDVALGTPVVNRSSIGPGSLLALVKYSPVPWLGVAARPEFIRSTVYTCTLEGCGQPSTVSSGRLYVGAELGELPGLGLGVAAGVTVGVLLYLLVSSAR